jgi:hypothetical protein
MVRFETRHSPEEKGHLVPVRVDAVGKDRVDPLHIVGLQTAAVVVHGGSLCKGVLEKCQPRGTSFNNTPRKRGRPPTHHTFRKGEKANSLSRSSTAGAHSVKLQVGSTIPFE